MNDDELRAALRNAATGLHPGAWWERPPSFNLIVIDQPFADGFLVALAELGFQVQDQQPWARTLADYLQLAQNSARQRESHRLLVEHEGLTVFVEPMPQVAIEEDWLVGIGVSHGVEVSGLIWERVSQTVALFDSEQGDWDVSDPPEGSNSPDVMGALHRLGLGTSFTTEPLKGQLLTVIVPPEHRTPGTT